MKIKNKLKLTLSSIAIGSTLAINGIGCAHKQQAPVTEEDAARINRKLVKKAVSFGPGSEDGAIVPDISSPCLRAEIVPEKIESNRLIEKHREWLLDCDVRLLGIPIDEQTKKNKKQKE